MEKNLREAILNKMRDLSTPDRPVYLVGGAVRDLLLNRPVHDLDFVVPGPTRSLAREVACRLNGALYVMDEVRDTTRVVLDTDKYSRTMLDFATLRADNLESDLRARDFSINAMAFDIAEPNRLLDPTGGLADLQEKQIRACSPDSLSHDPVRVLRAVRQALKLHFRIVPETVQLMRAAAPLLPRISAERLRDELFRMLDREQVALAVRLLDQVGALAFVLPEMQALKGITQRPPHVDDVWEHTLNTASALEQLLAPLVGAYQEDSVADLSVGSAVLWLGRFREQLEAHFNAWLVPDRSLYALLFFTGLYHDIAKPETRTESPEGKVHFLKHDKLGAHKAANRARALALSAAEASRVETIIDHHMRVHFMAESILKNPEDKPSRRVIYRFFRDTGEAGVDICLLSLADTRATYGVTLPQKVWEAELEACRMLLEAYWEKTEEVVSPPRLLTGNDLMDLFDLNPGRLLGKLLGAIREGQAAGEITDRDAAVAFARQWLEHNSKKLEGTDSKEGEK